jgi:hypothetical protein
MSFIRPDIRREIRRKLQAWPDQVTTISADQVVASDSLEVQDAQAIKARSIIEVGSEIERVRSKAGNILTVLRGDQLTTLALHAAGARVQSFPFWGWTDLEVNDKINTAIRWLFPAVYRVFFYENTALANMKEFGVPPGAISPTDELIRRVELRDSSTPAQWIPIYNWTHIGDRLLFGKPLDQDRRIRLTVQGKVRELATDVNPLDRDDPFDAIVKYATAECLDALLGNRTKYVEYSASLNDRASTPDELQRQAYHFRNQADVEKERVSRAPIPGFASTYRG